MVELLIAPDITDIESIEDADILKACIGHMTYRLDLVVTVEQVPLTPLAMGNYKTIVSVRKAREVTP